jgi:hypothetical protein
MLKIRDSCVATNSLYLTTLKERWGTRKVGDCLTAFSKGTHAMLVIPLIGAAVAVALGTRFRISVLLPATVLALVTTISFGIAARWGFGEVATTFLISLVAIEVGYLIGSLVSHFISAVRFKRAIVWLPRYHL